MTKDDVCQTNDIVCCLVRDSNCGTGTLPLFLVLSQDPAECLSALELGTVVDILDDALKGNTDDIEPLGVKETVSTSEKKEMNPNIRD